MESVVLQVSVNLVTIVAHEISDLIQYSLRSRSLYLNKMPRARVRDPI